MKLKCLGSNSAGNCYILENDTEALIIEAGIPFKEVKKALNFNISKIVGVIVSHAHLDHSKYISDYMKVGIEVYTSDETQEYLEIVTGEYTRSITSNMPYKIGNFIIQPFELIHDVPCLGFYIRHTEIGKLVFITDTEYVLKNFRSLKVNHILVEANYDRDLMCNEDFKRNHVLTGHMCIDTTCEFLMKNDNTNLINVVLLHLSSGSSDKEEFLEKAKQSVKSASVYVASKGLEINLDLVPFM